MACALTQGYTRKVCKDPSGIAEVLVGELANIATYTLTANVVTAFTLATGKQMWKYVQVPGVANFKCVGKGNAKNGGFGYDITGTMQIPEMSTLAQEETELLMKNNLFVIVKLQNGDYWEYGHEFGLDANPEGDTGTAMDDFKGDIINFTGMATMKPKKVTSSLITTLLAPAV